ncbi:MAG: hypothetical protein ABFD12_12975 [Syntrophorhabdus sp.]
MEFFIVMDKATLGQGVFGIFSTMQKAEVFSAELYREKHFHSQIVISSLVGSHDEGITVVYAAHLHDTFYDCEIFYGIYSHNDLAYDAVGDRGLIFQFVIDRPESRKLV